MVALSVLEAVTLVRMDRNDHRPVRPDTAQPDLLEARLRGTLPGPAAQRRMAPTRRPEAIASIPVEKCRHGAVLILLVPSSEGIEIPFIERSIDNGPHSGQIALPGGAREPGDDSPIATALREAREEIGLDTTHCRILGALTPLHIDVSGYLVTPVVAWWNRYSNMDPIAYRLNPREVNQVIPVKLSALSCRIRTETLIVRGYTVETPVYRVGKTRIWGATAMIMAELLHIMDTLH